MKKKPTDRELGILLREITGRMPASLSQGAVKVTKTTYNGADRFELTWRDEANRRCKLWYHNWRHALAAAKWFNAQLEAAKGKTSFTFNDAADKWIKLEEQRTKAKDPDLGETTFYTKTSHFKKVRERFGNMLLDDITSQEIEDWLVELSPTLKIGSLTARYGMIRSILKYAFERKMLSVNPLVMRPVRVPGRKSKRLDIPTNSDMELINQKIIYAPQPLNVHELTWSSMVVAIMLGASYGMRGGEVCALTWDDIEPDRINITKTTVGFGSRSRIKNWLKNDTNLRWVPLTPVVSAILSQHAVIYKEHFGKLVGHIVRSREYGSRSYFPRIQMSSRFSNMLVAIGVVKENGKPKFTFHALRHWFCSKAVQYLDPHYVGKLSGHKSAAILLDTYGHFIDDPDRRAKFEGMPSWLTPSGPALKALERPALAAPMILPPDGGPKNAGSILPPLLDERPARLDKFAEPPLPPPLMDLLPDPADEEEEPCPLSDVPVMASRALRKYIRLIGEGTPQPVACMQVGKTMLEIRTELRRLNMPDTREIKKRLTMKRAMALVDEGYRDREVARMVGFEDPGSVMQTPRLGAKTEAK